jgi:DNA-binding transcriptional regulator YiaG
MGTFDIVLHRLRKRYFGKQFSFATNVGCTESAVSFWERGRRLPWRRVMRRIVDCLRTAGAQSDEIDELESAYKHSSRSK